MGKETIKNELWKFGIVPEKSVSSLSAWQLCLIIIVAIKLIKK